MTGKERVFHIVGSNEADVLSGKISDLSPVGRALIGHKAGDVVTDTVEVSGAKFSYRIVEVSRD
jgi:transcription elongation factor GreA